MGIQYMTPKTGLPLIIETPGGIIDIRWDAGRRKRLVITLPDDLQVHRGEARGMANLKFLVCRDDGKLMPDYSLLAPDVDDQGAIRGVKRMERLTLRA